MFAGSKEGWRGCRAEKGRMWQRRWSRPAQVRPCGHDKDLDLHPGLSREKAVAVGNGWREHTGAWETRWEVHYKEASR